MSSELEGWAPASGGEPLPQERMRWFTGRFITARDLVDEQEYFLRRRWLLNRLTHGEGVLCGMAVVGHERADCRPTTVFVEPGVALDCAGRELVLDRRLCMTWPLSDTADETAYDTGGGTGDESANDTGDKPTDKPADEPGDETGYGGGERAEAVLLAVSYHEHDVAPRYAVQSACATSVVKEPSRVRECVEARLLTREEAPRCWPQWGAPTDDTEQSAPRHGGCLEPDCRCGGWLPLAILVRRDGGDIEIIPIAPGRPTRITRINWPHGGTLTLQEIRERRGRLAIEFDRPLLRPETEAAGINQFTFRVEYLGMQRATEIVPFEREPELVNARTAAFFIDPDLWDPKRGGSGRGWRPGLVGQAVTVTMFCDFVLDCNGDPVDGDHLRGERPTGNGRPGGVFRSWFTVSDGEGAAS